MEENGRDLSEVDGMESILYPFADQTKCHGIKQCMNAQGKSAPLALQKNFSLDRVRLRILSQNYLFKPLEGSQELGIKDIEKLNVNFD